jgi:catechol 2,3-dioxygenase-like lactoylglutathione lyase family enzyme
MRIRLVSVPVDDQGKARKFYTEVLGFQLKNDIPMGEFSWLTVVSPEDPDGAELVLEPNAFAPAQTYYRELKAAGIPVTSLEVENVEQEHKRLTEAGVVFTVPPTQAGPTRVATFDDTCGNLVQLHEA